jgi:hypothetical protein
MKFSAEGRVETHDVRPTDPLYTRGVLPPGETVSARVAQSTTMLYARGALPPGEIT